MKIVRMPSPDQVEEAIKIARSNSKELGFVTKAFYQVCQARGDMLVAIREKEGAMGFCLFHVGGHGKLTIYEIATSAEVRGLGYGRFLLEELKVIAKERGASAIFAKCPADLPSNEFYKKMGFTLVETLPGKKRALNSWHLRMAGGFLGGKGQ